MGGYATVLNLPVPPAIKGQDYQLKFMENFYKLDVDMVPYSQQYHTWINGIWFDNPPELNDKASIVAENGVGTLTWKKDTSPCYNTTIRTMQDFQYGYFEVDFRFDNVEGSWPAIWLLSSETLNQRDINSGEFDIMEWMSNTPNQCFFNFHKWLPGGQEDMKASKTVTFDAPRGFNFSDYHTYAMLWTPGRVDSYVDNKLVGTASPIDPEIEKQHYYIMVAAQAGLEWKDDPQTLAKIKAKQIQAQTRWVRVWQKQAK